MIKRYDFVDKVIYLIRKELEKKLPIEAPIDEMVDKYKELMKNIL